MPAMIELHAPDIDIGDTLDQRLIQIGQRLFLRFEEHALAALVQRPGPAARAAVAGCPSRLDPRNRGQKTIGQPFCRTCGGGQLFTVHRKRGRPPGMEGQQQKRKKDARDHAPVLASSVPRRGRAGDGRSGGRGVGGNLRPGRDNAPDQLRAAAKIRTVLTAEGRQKLLAAMLIDLEEVVRNLAPFFEIEA